MFRLNKSFINSEKGKTYCLRSVRFPHTKEVKYIYALLLNKQNKSWMFHRKKADPKLVECASITQNFLHHPKSNFPIKPEEVFAKLKEHLKPSSVKNKLLESRTFGKYYFVLNASFSEASLVIRVKYLI